MVKIEKTLVITAPSQRDADEIFHEVQRFVASLRTGDPDAGAAFEGEPPPPGSFP